MTPLDRLLQGNKRYVDAKSVSKGFNISALHDLAVNGQHPFAIVIACSDSRVIPETIFDCGLGELFVIRVAGNVIGEDELASIYYAYEHLHCHLVMVLGHTHCGAIAASLGSEIETGVAPLVEKIHQAIGDEADPNRASVINARHGANIIQSKLRIPESECVAAIYDIETGQVELV